MRRLTALLLACACAAAPQQAAQSVGAADAGTAGAGVPDAGAADGGLAYAPIVGADGGEMTLVVASEPGSSCAAWMPQPVDPVVTDVDTSPTRHFWGGGITDGRGDLVLTIGDDCCNFFVAPSADGGVTFIGFDGPAVPQPNGFLLDSIGQGACLICAENLLGYPAGSSVPLGNGIDSTCSFAPRTSGDGAYVSCVPQPTEGGPTFARYDASLQPLWSLPGDGNFVIQTDATGKLLELNSSKQWRWVDETLAPLSDWFEAPTNFLSYRPQPLIGGGLLDLHGRLIPSGSAAVTAAPEWLAARPGVSIVLGGRAYGLTANDCAVEIRDPAGALCGSVTIENCREPPSPGADGTITLPSDGSFPVDTHMRYVSWPRLLR
jgi:hypothetical protein